MSEPTTTTAGHADSSDDVALADREAGGALWELLALAGPTILQMASYTVMQFIDTWLLSRLGHVEAAAAGMSGLFTFSIISFGFGVIQLVNTLVSQNYGRGEYAACGRYLWQGVWFGLAYSLAVLPLGLLAGPMFRAMGHEVELAHLEAVYMQVMLLSTFAKLVGTSAGQFVLGIDRPRVVLWAAVAGVACNALAAYAWTLGRLGFSSHGIVGAAWAQNLGVCVETLVLLVFAFRRPLREKFHSLDWRLDRRAMGTLVRIGGPSGAQFVADVLAWSMFSSVVLATSGETAMAANTFTFRFMAVSFMPAFGIGTAITALVGRYIGMGREDLAIHRANLGFRVNAVYMLTCGVAFYVWRNDLMRLFTSDPDVLRVGATLLVFAAVYQASDALYCSYSGALRGAGDTFVPAVATAVLP